MAYTDHTTPYVANETRHDHAPVHARARRDVGATVFLWLAWAVAAFFWVGALTTAVSIMGAEPGAVAAEGGADAGGIGWGLINFVGGLIVLGLAIAYGSYRYASRDKRRDPMTEASTAALYDTIESQGGEDMTTRSPEARKPAERDAYRDLDPGLR
jgi:hypothetical protein